MVAPLKVGLAGLGTVGTSVIRLIADGELASRCGRPVEVVAVTARSKNKDRGVDLSKARWVADPVALAQDPGIDVFVELMGGEGDPAKAAIEAALRAGKSVVTANKALLAKHGLALGELAEINNVAINFEAAVAGAIPVIKTLREGFAGNSFLRIYGILNGTCNYILTRMEQDKLSFADCLKDAQRLGYAEADPTFDVEGIDAAHKLTILAAIAFGIPLQFKKAYTEGITRITRLDVEYAEQLGYRIKSLGIARRTDKGVELRVHPTLIPERRLIANVDGVMNAVLVKGDAVGPILSYGAGAGADPTASAVVADIVDVVRTLTSDPNNRVPHLAFQPDQLSDLPVLPMEEVETAYYLRLQAQDKPGVLADVTRILADLGISIEAILQKEPRAGENTVPVIILTQRVLEKHMNQAIAEIEALPSINTKIMRIRLEHLNRDWK
jgi:homoserine dehydrogenase